MGTALLTLAGLFNRLSTAPSTANVSPKRQAVRIHPVWAQRPGPCTPMQVAPAHASKRGPLPAALRILRIQDQDIHASSAGRMVISGRMADVCAELDRLVALEAQQRSS